MKKTVKCCLQCFQEITQRQESDAGNAKMRILPKMLDGYHHFLSIRKATFSLAEDTNFSKMFKDEEIDPNVNPLLIFFYLVNSHGS